jgi:hypothetical protein
MLLRLPPGVDIEPLDLLVERGERYVQTLSRFGLAPAVLHQALDDS